MQKKKVFMMVILIIVLTVALVIWLLNEVYAQIISIFFILGIAAIVLAKNLEKAGMRTLLLAAEPVFLILCSALEKTEFAELFSASCNAVIEFVTNKIDVENTLYIGNQTALLVLFWVLFITATCVFNGQDRTAMGKHRGSDISEFREKNFTERSEAFCKTLRQRLEALNRETDWNESLFTPIEAEVEVSIKGRRKKKYADLLKCLKKTRRGSDVFLVLGDPGSGKSVSLRKLCLELLDESKKTKKIPVYINLKKWNKNWCLDLLPNRNDLINFVKESLYENGDFFTDGFLNRYFDNMLEDGRWYFIFDSFDEMPCLMGKQYSQELIDHISELIFQFLTGNNQNGGVIASRLYRAPSEVINPTVILRIQEFSDIKIRTMLNKYLDYAEEAVKELFGSREDLVVLCRNPFYLTLLINYIKEKGTDFPANQMDLYSNFVKNRLERCAGKIESERFSTEEVHQAAKNLAVFFEESTKYGLECPVCELYKQSGNNNQEYWQKAIKILEYAKICRFGGSEETVSFVHRRFQEFFFVESIIERRQSIGEEEYKSITHSTGIRDALVLYCEVTDDEKAREIAAYCWKAIQENIAHRKSILNEGGMILVNVLDFMTEAFRNRKSALNRIIDKFEELVIDSMDEDTDFIVLLALTNSMVLFNQDYLQETVLKVFELKKRWLNDLIMKNCRLIHQLDDRVETKFATYFFHMDAHTFLKRFRNTDFSLSIPKSFSYIRTIHTLTFVRYITILFAAMIIMILSLTHVTYMIGNIFQQSEVIANQETGKNIAEVVLIAAVTFLYLPKSKYYEMNSIKHNKGFLNAIFLYYRKALLPMAVAISLTIGALLSKNTILYLLLFVVTLGYTLVEWIIFAHDLYFSFKRQGFELLKKILSMSALLLVVLLSATAIALILEKLLERVFIFVFSACFVLLTIIILVNLIRYFIFYCKDRYWVTHRPSIQSMNRSELANNLNSLHFTTCKCQYVEMLLQNKTMLEGNWPSEGRPGKEDNDLERLLAKMDCLSLEYYSCVF